MKAKIVQLANAYAHKLKNQIALREVAMWKTLDRGSNETWGYLFRQTQIDLRTLLADIAYPGRRPIRTNRQNNRLFASVFEDEQIMILDSYDLMIQDWIETHGLRPITS